MKWIYSRTRNKNITQDISQTFWIKIWENASSYKTDKNASAKKYLLTTLSNHIIDYLRSGESRLEGVDEQYWEFLTETTEYTHVLENIEQDELRQIITLALESLPEMTQKIFDLRWNQQRSVEETASLTDLSERMVKYHYGDAKNSIKDKLKHMYKSVQSDPNIKNELLLVLLALELDLFIPVIG